jgi:SNF2 family DNA or RNA helicase
MVLGKHTFSVPSSRKAYLLTLCRKSFEHIITGSKSQAPQLETGGGILADDMGLGKTLTCIAMITRTSQLATEFWRSGCSVQESLKDSPHTARHAARATLVIVPSQGTHPNIQTTEPV